jgi:protein tyrosine/serine phosphatase
MQHTTPIADFTKDAPTHLPSPPFITVSGVPNFRDLGGYASATHPNHRVKPGLMYRCAQLSQITPEGTQTLTSDLNIHHLYDLRSQPELDKLIEAGHPIEIDGVKRKFIPVYEEQDYSPVVLATKYGWYTSPDINSGDDYSRGFVNAYRDIAKNAGPAYRHILLHVRDDADKPFIFHCTAGKDRTGVLGGMVLKLCGVDDETIAWEYSITEPGLGSWRETILRRLMRGGMGAGTQGQGMSRAEAERICGSRKGNMVVFLREVVEGEFGGVRQYLKDYCKFSDEDVDTIRKNLMEEGEPVAKPVHVKPYEPTEEDRMRGKKGAMGLAKEGSEKIEEKVMTG